jgi:hypothetical protein
MIVESKEGTALEVFWRLRGTTYWSYPTAHRFLLRFCLDRDTIRRLRGILAQRAAGSDAWRISEDEVVQRVARLISSGRIIIAENRWMQLWPDTGVVLESRGQSVLLLSKDELFPARDLAVATRWVHGLQKQQQRISELDKGKGALGLKEKEEKSAYAREMEQVRRRLATGTGVADYAHLDDRAFLAGIEASLLAGELVPLYHAVSGHTEGTEAAPPPPPVAGGPSGPDKEDMTDPNTFGPSHNGSAQAQTLAQAALDGVPFCEECARAAMN